MNDQPVAWLDEALEALGATLEARGHHYELVVVGGACLLLHGTIDRPTRDIDILGALSTRGDVVPLDGLPAPLAEAVAAVGAAYHLAPDWLNLGPSSLLDLGLPDGFESRLKPRRLGGLVAWLASPFDLACFKLYAAVDHWPLRDRHLADLRALAPTTLELQAAAAWATSHDPSPAFATNLAALLRSLESKASDDSGR